MTVSHASPVLAALCASALTLAAFSAQAQTAVDQAAEHRFQLDFRVPDAALQKMLPAGWEPAIATQGPAKDANLRMIFIDRVAVIGADGKPVGNGTSRLVYLAIPVKQTAGGATGQMIVHGLTENAADAPGAFGVYQHAATATMSRAAAAMGGKTTGAEDWEFKAANGEFMQVHVTYERGPATKGGAEVKFFNPTDPTKFQVFKTDQAIDIIRNVTTNPPDRVKEFSYKAGGGKIAALFDGTEKVLSWDVFPWYVRTVTTP